MATATVNQVVTTWKIEAENGFFEKFESAGINKQVAAKQFKKQHPDAGKIIKIEQVSSVETTVNTPTNGNGNAVQPIKAEDIKKEDKDALKSEHPETLKDLVKLSETKAVNTMLSKVIYGQTIAVVGSKINLVGEMKEDSYTGYLYFEIRKKLMLAGSITLDTVILDSDFKDMLLDDGFTLKDFEAIEKQISQGWCHGAKLKTIAKKDAKNAQKVKEALERRAKYR